MKNLLLLLIIPLIITSCKNNSSTEDIVKLEAPLFDGLGDLHFPISTKSEYSQKFFNQGLTLSYAFNHVESKRSFVEAARLDSTCAMAYWGWALVLGTNINAAMSMADLAEINAVLDKANKYAKGTTEKEQGLISALTVRYPKDSVGDLSEYHAAYAHAMRTLHQKFPDDVEISTMLAEALMDEHPWDYWLKDGTPQPWTPEIVSLLETTLKSAPKHPGANHFYIHITEASKTPEKAMASADLLRDLLPTAGHLTHMPSHTYIRTGRYHDGVIANEKATLADSAYISQCKAQGVYPLAYYPHNDHFLTACAFLSGESRKSIAGAYATQRHTQHEYLREAGFGTLQHYSVIPLYVLVGFARWDDILNYTPPDSDLVYPNTIYHYAMGMAYSGKGDVAKANAQLVILKKYAALDTLKLVTIWEINTCYDLAQIALHTLTADIATKAKNYNKAIGELQSAIAIEDALIYNEPPDWFFSVRLHLGDVLLKAGKYPEAQKIYEEDLENYPENGWALIGLHQALTAQQKNVEAEAVKKRFDAAWQFADFEIKSSRVM